MSKKFKMPLTGMTAQFDGPLDVLALCQVEALALSIVASGGILKLDAVQGQDLERTMLAALPEEMHVEVNRERLAERTKDDPTGWYGVVPAIGIAVGPYDRKSQAMNGLTLSLMGFDVEPARSKRTPEQRTRDRLVAAGADPRAVDEALADIKGPTPHVEDLVMAGLPQEVAEMVARSIPDGMRVVGVTSEHAVDGSGSGFGAVVFEPIEPSKLN